jgi:hypothetical protein
VRNADAMKLRSRGWLILIGLAALSAGLAVLPPAAAAGLPELSDVVTLLAIVSPAALLLRAAIRHRFGARAEG